MNFIDKIKARTEQILMKSDEFVRNYGVHTGMGAATVSVLSGIGGVAAIAGGVGVGSLAAVAAAPVMIMGVPIAAAGALLLGGGAAGIGFAGLSKLYKEFRGGEVQKHVWGPQHLECVDNDGKKVKLDAMDVYKEIELGTFKNKYQSLIVQDRHNNNPEQAKAYKADSLTLENTTALVLNNNVNSSSAIDNIETVRRNIIKEAKSSSIIAKVSDALNKFQETDWVQNAKTRKFN